MKNANIENEDNNSDYINKIQQVFEYYCQYGERLNSKILKSHKFIKLFRESGLMDEKLDNVKKELDKYKLLKLGRYYVLDNDITVKCHNCGEIGHIRNYI